VKRQRNRSRSRRHRWRDYAHGNRKRMTTIQAEEFLRRFLLHVLPRGFVRIRSFGFLANRRRATLLSLRQQLLRDHPQPTTPSSHTPHLPACFRCPQCATPMVRLAKHQTIFTYYSTLRLPKAKNLRIGQAKPIAPPLPPRQRLPPNPPIANAPAPNNRALPGCTAPGHLR
jgi:hypothetical protein